MKLTNIISYKKGWFIGDFEPSLFKSSQFEIALKLYKKGDSEDSHFHRVATEYTIVSCGKFKMNESILGQGDIVELSPGEVSKFECLEDGNTFVVKVPSVIGDKYAANI